MQTKDSENQVKVSTQGGDKNPAKVLRIQRILTPIISILFGLVALVSFYIIASLAVTFGTDTNFTQFISIISIGFIHLLSSITSSILWIKNVKWSRYPIMILAVISTLVLTFTFFSPSIFIWFVVAILLNIYLFSVLFLHSKQA